jgi:hypothetical protein
MSWNLKIENVMYRTLLSFLFSLLFKMMLSQTIYVRETDSSGYFRFNKLSKGIVSAYKGSYDILKGQPVDFMIQWGISKNKDLYWTNGENIYKYNFANQSSIQAISNLHFILAFFIIDHFAFVAYNPSREEGLHDNRYARGLKFCRVDLNNGVKKYYPLPVGLNMSNLTVSPGMDWASFMSASSISSSKTINYKMILYDLENEKTTIIDSAKPADQSSFGDDEQYNSSLWSDSSTFVYYKHVPKSGNGRLFSYNIHSKSIKSELFTVPDQFFSWFGYYNRYFYFSERDNIYRINDTSKKKIVLSNPDVLQAVVTDN